jgi:hypothetical protein
MSSERSYMRVHILRKFKTQLLVHMYQKKKIVAKVVNGPLVVQVVTCVEQYI